MRTRSNEIECALLTMVIDYGNSMPNQSSLGAEVHMEPEKIAISKFKATCLGLLKQVNQRGEPILVTLKGEPIAMVVPPPQPKSRTGWMGARRHSGKIKADIVEPAAEASDWEVLGK
jgi:prevent-host-death family protein